MISSDVPYPYFESNLNLVVCIKGSMPDIKLANTTKTLVLSQLIEDLVKGNMQVKTLGFKDTPNQLPLLLQEDFTELKKTLMLEYNQGIKIVVINSLQALKVGYGGFNENMNKMVKELIDLAKQLSLTIIIGVEISQLENIPAYALNKKASLWVLDTKDHNTTMSYKNQVVYDLDFDPQAGVIFDLLKEPKPVKDYQEEIVKIKQDLALFVNQLIQFSQAPVVVELLNQTAKTIQFLSNEYEQLIRKQIKLKDLIATNNLKMTDRLLLQHKGKSYLFDLVMDKGEVVLNAADGTIYTSPSGAASTLMSRSANGWTEFQVVNNQGEIQGDLLSYREEEVRSKTTIQVSSIVVNPPYQSGPVKALTHDERIIEVFQDPQNKGKLLDYIEVYQEVYGRFPGAFKGKTPEFTVSRTLGSLVTDGKLKVAKPSGGKSKYYL